MRNVAYNVPFGHQDTISSALKHTDTTLIVKSRPLQRVMKQKQLIYNPITNIFYLDIGNAYLIDQKRGHFMINVLFYVKLQVYWLVFIGHLSRSVS